MAANQPKVCTVKWQFLHAIAAIVVFMLAQQNEKATKNGGKQLQLLQSPCAAKYATFFAQFSYLCPDVSFFFVCRLPFPFSAKNRNTHTKESTKLFFVVYENEKKCEE